MTAGTIAAVRLPEVRTRLVDELTPVQRGTAVVESYVLAASTGVQIHADPRIADPVAQALLLAHNEGVRLREASLYWVSPSMAALTLAAAPGMSPFRPTTDDLPSPNGLIYFAAPLGEFTEDGPADQVTFTDGTVMDIPRGQQYKMCAATWGPYDRCGMWPDGGIWFSFYTGRNHNHRVERFLINNPSMTRAEAERLARQQPELTIDNEVAVSCTHLLPGPDPLLDLAHDAGKASYWMHLVLTAFRLMDTAKAATVTPQRIFRKTVQRAHKTGVTRPGEPVRLVDITSRPARRGPQDAGAGERSRTYRVRWAVNGHWRNQWYPGSEQHRPRWIDGYVKGPEDAPLKVRDTVHLWRDPSERETS